MDELLGGPLPLETAATCDSCAMCPDNGADLHSANLFFRRDAKCCTYLPQLANFLVGRILSDDDPVLAAGRATVEARLEARIAVTPLGLMRPPVQDALYRLGGPQAFGRNRTLRCPHYLETGGGRCGIWPHRNGICATWFCKHTRGAVGLRFWQRLERLITAAEHHLSRWCLLELGVDGSALAKLLPLPTADDGREAALEGGQIDGVVDGATYQTLWGRWYGRERAFFREAAHLVSGLTWHDVVMATGAEVRLLAGLAVDGYRELMADTVPERLTVGRFTTSAAGPQHVRVSGYSGMHPLDLPRALFTALTYFDGRRTSAVLRTIEAEAGIRLDRGLVRKLVDFEILVPLPEDIPGENGGRHEKTAKAER